MAVAKILGGALAEASRLPFIEAKRRVSDAAREAASVAATKQERIEVKRRAAESILLLACSRNDSWSATRAAFAGVEALGFTDADRHVQDAALLARWCIDHRAHLDEAVRELRRARLHVKRLRKDPTLRARLLEQLAEMEGRLAR